MTSNIRIALTRSQKIRFGAKTAQGRRALLHGVAASIEHCPLLQTIDAPGTIIDVGANRGQFALLARQLYPMARVISFEPNPAAASAFLKILGDDENVELHQMALGRSNTLATLNITQADDNSSLLEPTGLQIETATKSVVKATTTVPVRRLDEVIAKLPPLESPILLKLDVQGYELEVLHGAANALQSFDYILAELSFAQLYEHQPHASSIISHLKRHKFQIADIGRPSRHHGSLTQLDTLFRRDIPTSH